MAFVNGCISSKNYTVGTRFFFAARDGYPMWRLYTEYFAEAEYLPISRAATQMLAFSANIDAYVDANLQCLIGMGETLGNVLQRMGIDACLPNWQKAGLTADAVIDKDVLQRLKQQLTNDREKIETIFAPAKANAAAYFRTQFAGCQTVAVVDTGWKGSSTRLLQSFCKSENIPVQLTNVLLGTSAGASVQCQIEANLLHSYLFSTSQNCALLQRHMRHMGGVCALTEMLCSTEHPPLLSYAKAADGGFTYGEVDVSTAQLARREWEGIHDFAEEFHGVLSRLGWEVTVTADDAYAPFDALTADEDTLLKVFGDLPYGMATTVRKREETGGVLFLRKKMVSSEVYRRWIRAKRRG
ncbi:MAG: DUF4350 domain-containing protein [Clostridia bacterium]